VKSIEAGLGLSGGISGRAGLRAGLEARAAELSTALFYNSRRHAGTPLCGTAAHGEADWTYEYKAGSKNGQHDEALAESRRRRTGFTWAAGQSSRGARLKTGEEVCEHSRGGKIPIVTAGSPRLRST